MEQESTIQILQSAIQKFVSEVCRLDLEFVALLAIGLYLHLNGLSVIDLKYSKLPGLQPNVASLLFVFSVLCVFGKSRPYLPSCFRRAPRVLRFFVELLLALYLNDLILRQVWIPMLRFLDFACDFLAEYTILVNRSILAKQMTAISRWLKNDAFYYARFLLAFGIACFMAVITGLVEYCCNIELKFGKKFATIVEPEPKQLNLDEQRSAKLNFGKKIVTQTQSKLAENRSIVTLRPNSRSRSFSRRRSATSVDISMPSISRKRKNDSSKKVRTLRATYSIHPFA